MDQTDSLINLLILYYYNIYLLIYNLEERMPFLGNSLNGFNRGYRDWLILKDKISSIFLTSWLAGTSVIFLILLFESDIFSSIDMSSVAVDITCTDNLCRASPYIIS